MQDESARPPRRRPVDALFGEPIELAPKPNEAETAKNKSQTPGYLVEPPRPAPFLRPPPPEFPNDWRAIAPPEPGAPAVVPFQPVIQVSEPVPAPPSIPVAIPVAAEPPTIESIIILPPAVEKLVPPAKPVGLVPPALGPVLAPALEAPALRPDAAQQQQDMLALSQFIDQLYQNVADETSDYAALNAECQNALRAARVAIEKGDYAQAEYHAEQVKARLLRARASQQAAGSPSTQVIILWLVATGMVGILVFLMPFVVRLVPLAIPILRGAALGALGASIAALWTIARIIRQREYDPHAALEYALAPARGAVLGLVIFLLSVTGILAAPGALGSAAEPYLLMYLFALVGGIGSDAIFAGLRGLIPGVGAARAAQ